MRKFIPNFRRKRTWIIIVILIAIIGGYRWYSVSNTKPIVTANVERQTVREEIVLSGEIKSKQDASLAFQTSGPLIWVGVAEGQAVVKGQALMKLDTMELNSAFEKAKSDLRSAEATVAKVHDSLKDKGNSETYTEKETRTIAEVAKDKAYESFISAQKDLKDATLVAPFAGIVTSVTNPAPGVNVTAGVVQVRIVNPNAIYFSVSADQTEVTSFKVGDQAEIILDAYEDDVFAGTIGSISFAPASAESGTVYPIQLTFAGVNTVGKYKIGMSGDAKFVVKEKQNALSVPSKFINSDKEGKYVNVDQGKTKKYVEIGIEGEDRTEIVSDISEGTVVYD